ncbi:uncharacterized protein CDV56_107576 [Aspergillus thermomutatus]|uniref:N-acetylgalactosaminide beta-1,3-galactosyltransferase n=1 Tax=Aspergillus thermomutatus TaxID=41047 RepID=A0A397H0E8_ASPTH|nr:uncharacterized protein CDV56_107576 [Aspergillus thermomutatus]RHZ56605.1 hypothetical protein CDV56_107576 [Aspergillus thermomutatus]
MHSLKFSSPSLPTSSKRRQRILSRRTSILVFILLVVAASIIYLGFRCTREFLSTSSVPFHLINQDDDADYWDWETLSHFTPEVKTENNDKIFYSNQADDDDDLCNTFPSYLLSRIQVVLKLGSSEPADRLHTHTATVTRCISNLIIVSDRESEDHHIHDVLATYPPSFWVDLTDYETYKALQLGNGKPVDGTKGWNLDRFKFLPMVEHAYRINPAAEWFIFLETDTYVFWDNVFRLLDHYDPQTSLYFGSPAPGRMDGDRQTYFAYGGSGFILSVSAVKKLLKREVGLYGQYKQPSVAMQFADLTKGDCCGDSVLGWALHQKGIELSGLWPMFNAHALHGIPFDEVHWCQPVISLHKTQLADMNALIKFENQRNRTYPLLYADLMDFLKLGTFAEKVDWDNGDWGGFQERPESPAHSSFSACRTACHDHPQCLSYTYDSSGHCIFVRAIRLGSEKVNPPESRLSAGWDAEKIKDWQARHRCEKPMWVKPSLKRIF